MTVQDKVNQLYENQLAEWDLARKNYGGLKKVEIKSVEMPNGASIKVQYNPERIRSSAAKVDEKSINERPCFLCDKNRPKEQKSVEFGDFKILINPYPIFPRHLTIVHNQHINQEIKPFFSSMLESCKALPDYTVFYNGPKCGASAPDHFHFQAVPKNMLPIEADYEADKYIRIIFPTFNSRVVVWQKYCRSVITLASNDAAVVEELFKQVFTTTEEQVDHEPEPMLNIISYYRNERYIVHLLPRALHRPICYFHKGENQILISPASVDLGGVLITPRKEDFDKITVKDITSIFRQVCLSKKITLDITKEFFLKS